MVSVAQKTLLLAFFAIFSAFGAHAEDKKETSNPFFTEENLNFSVKLNGIDIGNANISYRPNKEKGNYSIVTKAKTEGPLSKIYSIDEYIYAFGYIKDNNLIPKNQTVMLNENKRKTNRTAFFDYKNSIVNVQNNLEKRNENLLLIDNAKDILSTLFELRFNTDFINLKEEVEFHKVMQFAHKTAKNNIKVGSVYNFKLPNGEKIPVRDVLIESKKIRMKNISQEQINTIKSGEKKPEEYKESLMVKKKYKFRQNIKIIVTNDEKKEPVAIYYHTNFGTFKATLKKYE